jgi:hypothetical protein
MTTSGTTSSPPQEKSWLRDDVLALAGILAFCFALGGAGSLVVTPAFGALATALLLGASAFVLGLAGRMLVVLSLALVAGLSQGLLAAFTSSSSALWLDDACLPGLIAATFVLAARQRRLSRLVILSAVFLAASLVATALAPSLDVAVYQFRQAAVPAVLLAAGWTAGREVLTAFGKFLLFIGLVYLAFMALEILGLRVVDPWAANGLNPFTGGVSDHNLSRELPPNYYYYVGEDRLVRAGGLHFNPPGASLFIASLVIYAQLLLAPTKRVLYVLLASLGVLTTLGRGGGVYLAIALGQRPVSRWIGRAIFGALVLLAGVFLTEFFSSQGNKSDTHTQGLLSGVTFALTHPLGSGFGTIGNVTGSASADGATGESLVGLFLASYGWLGLLTLAALLGRGLWLGNTIPGAALTAAVVVAMFTESASGLALTLPMWFAAGLGLQSRSRLAEQGWATPVSSPSKRGTKVSMRRIRP